MTEHGPGGRLAGRRILITGAASGIGRATACRFAEAGASLSLLDRQESALQELGRKLGASTVVLDLENESAIAGAVSEAAAALGGLDGVVSVAGIAESAQLGYLQLDVWNRMIAVNLTAPFLVMREALPHLLHAGGTPTVVNVSSGQGLRPSAPGMGAYCASKGGLVTFTKAMALELGPRIRVNAVCPGVVDTPLVPDTIKRMASTEESPYALKRMAGADEIADAILFLTSSESGFVTGSALAVDGGRTYH